jgi:hypothetical protein
MIQTVQQRLSLLVLAAILITVAAVSVLAHVTPTLHNKLVREIELHRTTNGYYLFNGGYVDDGDYLLIGQLPSDDYSRGGVYFIGASEMNTAIMTWTLPPAERKLIHNYAIGDLRHTEARHFVRMLIEDFDLLQAGGEKTTIILGLSYQMAREKASGAGYIKELFHRHRYYKYDWKAGIQRVQLSQMERNLRLGRDQVNRYLRALLLAPNMVQTEPWPRGALRGHLEKFMPGDWRRVMASEVEELASLIDYLQAQKVRVKAILHPNGSWQGQLPYDAEYRKLVMPVLEARSVPVSDFGNMLTDEEFFDAVHARYNGQIKLHKAYRDLALHALAEMGTDIEP